MALTEELLKQLAELRARLQRMISTQETNGHHESVKINDQVSIKLYNSNGELKTKDNS